MLCPLKFGVVNSDIVQEAMKSNIHKAIPSIRKVLDCEEKDCAWWMEYEGRCAINQIANELRIMAWKESKNDK